MQLNINKDEIVKNALSFVGTKYKMGAKNANTGCIDCSGLVYQAYKNNGIYLPQGSFNQFKVGSSVESGKLEKGDMLFFKYPTNDTKRKNLPVTHIGIYDGNGNIIEASSSKGKVSVRPFKETEKYFMGAKRITGKENVEFNPMKVLPSTKSTTIDTDTNKSFFGSILDDPNSGWSEPTVQSALYNKNEGMLSNEYSIQQENIDRGRDLETYNSTLGERITSIAGIIADTSVPRGAGRIFDKTAIELGFFGDKNDDYIKSSDYDYRVKKLQEYGAEPTLQNIELLGDATNIDNEDYILSAIKQKEYARDFYQEHLTRKEISVANITSDLGIQAGLLWRIGGAVSEAKVLTGGKTVGNIAGATVGFGANYALNKTIQYGDRDFSDREVGVFTAIGGIVDTLGGVLNATSKMKRIVPPEDATRLDNMESGLKEDISQSVDNIERNVDNAEILKNEDINLDRTYKEPIVETTYREPNTEDILNDISSSNTFTQLDELAKLNPETSEFINKLKDIKKIQKENGSFGSIGKEKFVNNVNKIDEDLKITLEAKNNKDILDIYTTGHSSGAISTFDDYVKYFKDISDKSSVLMKNFFNAENELNNIMKSGKYTQSQVKKATKLLTQTEKLAKEQYSKIYDKLNNKELYERLSDNVDKIVMNLEEELNNKYILGMDNLQRTNSLKSLGEELSNTFGSKIKVIEENGKIKIVGNVKLKIKDDKVSIGNNKLKIGAVLAFGGVTGAMADDGSSYSAGDIGIIALAVLSSVYFGKAGLKTIRQNGFTKSIDTFKKRAKAIVSTAENALEPNAKKENSIRQAVLNASKVKVASVFWSVEQKGSKEAYNVLKKILPSPIENLGTNAYLFKFQQHEGDMSLFNTSYSENYKLFREEAKKLNIDYSEEAFNLAHSNSIERPNTFASSPYKNFKSIENIKRDTNSIYKNRIFDDAVKAGVEGTGDVQLVDNYRPHIYKDDNLISLYNNPKTKDKLIKSFQNMIKNKTTLDLDLYNMGIKEGTIISDADSYSLIKAFLDKKINSSDFLFSKEAFDTSSKQFLDKYIKIFNITDKAKIKKLEDSILSNTITNRFKFRMKFNFDDWEDFTIKNDLGDDVKISLDDIFEQNQRKLLAQYSLDLRGQTGLKISGIDDLTFNNMIKAEPNKDVIESLQMAKNIVEGKSLIGSGNEFANSIQDAVKNLTVASVVGLSGLSVLPEFALSVKNMLKTKGGVSEWFTGLKEVLTSIKNTETIKELTPMGIGLASNNLHIFKNSDFLVENAGNGIVSNWSKNMLESVLRIGRLTSGDDFAKRTAVYFGYNSLSNIVKGEKNLLTPNQMKRFGITDDLIKMVKDNNLIIEKNGMHRLNELEFNKLSLNEKANFQQAIWHLTNSFSVYATPSSVSKFFINNPTGRLLGALLSFSLSLYNSIFIGALKYGDKSTAMDWSLYFGGAVTSVWARNKIFGKEDLEDEELIKRALMQMPFMGGVGALQGITNPIIFQKADKVDTTASKVVSDIGGLINNDRERE